jgi:tetratricopeptide (TPR) repeat protein
MRKAADAGKLRRKEQLIIDEVSLMRLAGRLDEALLAVSDCIELFRDSGLLRNIRALCLHDLGRDDEAVEEHQAAARLSPSSPVLIGNLGTVYHEAGRLDEAVATLRRALSLNPSLGYVYERLADIARQRGDEAAATKELGQAEAGYLRRTNDDPFDRRGWENLARVRASLGDYEGAESARRMILQIDRTDRFDGIPDAVIQGTRMVRN